MIRFGFPRWVSVTLLAGVVLAGGRAFAQVLALTGATVIDVAERGRAEDDTESAVVLVEDGRIAAVGSAGEVKIPGHAEVLDVSGLFIVPGLTDGFAAINNQSYADAYLYNGVTTIIAVSGGRRGNLFTAAAPGPHLKLLDSVGFETAGLDDHLRATQELAEQGIDIALLMYRLTPEQLPVVAKRAEKLGMGTIGELALTSYPEGIEAGVDAFVHTTRYSLSMAPADMIRGVVEQPFSDDLESPKWRYYMWLSQLSPHDPRLAEYAGVLGSGEVSLMPTLSLLYLDLPWNENPWDRPTARILDPADINNPANRATGRHDSEPAHQAAYSALARSEFILEEAYFRAGARYLAGSGTDVWGTMPGISLHHELEGLARIGHSPREALAAATGNFELTLASWGPVGQVRPGYQADLLVLEEDPREDVKHLESIRTVVLQGRVFNREDLLRVSGPGGD